MPFCNLKNFLLLNHGLAKNCDSDFKKRQLNYSLHGAKICFSAVYCLEVETVC